MLAGVGSFGAKNVQGFRFGGWVDGVSSFIEVFCLNHIFALIHFERDDFCGLRWEKAPTDFRAGDTPCALNFFGIVAVVARKNSSSDGNRDENKNDTNVHAIIVVWLRWWGGD